MTTPLDPSLFDLRPEVLWVMHCAVGPVPRACAQAVRERLEKEQRPWEVRSPEWELLPARVRSLAPRVIGGDPSDLTFTASTSAGLTAVAQAFPWAAGDEVLAPLGEFPTKPWPWKAPSTTSMSTPWPRQPPRA